MTVSEVIEQVKIQQRNTLTEAESKKILKEYGIPVEAVYGFQNKLIAQASRFLPRKIVTRMVRKMHE